jgi:hypothetical protein
MDAIKISQESLDAFKKETEQVNKPKTFYGEQIEALKKALEFCEKGGCKDAVPFITRRIHWMQENDFVPYKGWCFA